MKKILLLLISMLLINISYSQLTLYTIDGKTLVLDNANGFEINKNDSTVIDFLYSPHDGGIFGIKYRSKFQASYAFLSITCGMQANRDPEQQQYRKYSDTLEKVYNLLNDTLKQYYYAYYAVSANSASINDVKMGTMYDFELPLTPLHFGSTYTYYSTAGTNGWTVKYIDANDNSQSSPQLQTAKEIASYFDQYTRYELLYRR